MKKISILALHLGYGGIEKSITALANLLATDYKVEIGCVYKLYDKPIFDLDPRVKVKYLTKIKPNNKKFKKDLRKKRLFSALKEGVKGLKGLYIRRSSTIKYITSTDSDIIISTRDIFNDWLGEYGGEDILKIGWEHNHYHDNLKYAGEIVRTASKLDYLVVVSNALQEFYSKQLQKSKCKCVYIPNVLDYIPKKVSKLENKKLISIGRLSKEKGYIDLLTIYNFIEKKYPDWTLDIIGDGEERENLEKYIKSHNLENRIILHGFQGKDYINKMLSESSIYLMTSYTESFGIVLIEAMSFGIPCIAFSSAEGARELIDSGRNGYLIKNRNMRAYVEKLEDLMNSFESRKKIGKEGRKSVKKYDGKEIFPLWVNIIEKK